MNFFGLKYLRFISVLVLIRIHCMVWVARGAERDFSGGLVDMGLLSLFSLMIPATAGAIFRASLDKYLVRGRLENFSVSKAGALFLALALVESFKGMAVYGPGNFFLWNVLHFAGLSLLVITALARWSTRWVPVAGVVVLCSAPLVRKWLGSAQMVALHEVWPVYHSLFLNFVLLVLSSFAFFMLLRWLLLQRYLKSSFKYGLTGILSLCFAVSLFFFSYYEPEDPAFVGRVYNLPVGILTGDPHGYHIWPFFPWFAIVAYGFAVYHGYMSVLRKGLFRGLLLAASIAMLGYFFLFYFPDFQRAYSLRSLWSAQIFQANHGLVLGVMGAFGLNVLFCDLIERKWKFLGFEFMVTYGRAIFWIYLFVTSAGIPMGRWVASYFSFPVALVVFQVMMFVICYFVAVAAVRLIGDRAFHVRLVPKKPQSPRLAP